MAATNPAGRASCSSEREHYGRRRERDHSSERRHHRGHPRRRLSSRSASSDSSRRRRLRPRARHHYRDSYVNSHVSFPLCFLSWRRPVPRWPALCMLLTLGVGLPPHTRLHCGTGSLPAGGAGRAGLRGTLPHPRPPAVCIVAAADIYRPATVLCPHAALHLSTRGGRAGAAAEWLHGASVCCC